MKNLDRAEAIDLALVLAALFFGTLFLVDRIMTGSVGP